MNVYDERRWIFTFRNAWPTRNERQVEPPKPSDAKWLDYCRSRELAERGAAKNADSGQARRVHQELAQSYARVIQRAGW